MFTFNSSTMNLLVYPVDLYQNTPLTNGKPSKRDQSNRNSKRTVLCWWLKEQAFWCQWCTGTEEVESMESLWWDQPRLLRQYPASKVYTTRPCQKKHHKTIYSPNINEDTRAIEKQGGVWVVWIGVRGNLTAFLVLGLGEARHLLA